MGTAANKLLHSSDNLVRYRQGLIWLIGNQSSSMCLQFSLFFVMFEQSVISFDNSTKTDMNIFLKAMFWVC